VSAAEHPVTTAVVVAAGAGVRMGAGMPKALLPLGGRPLLAWSLDALAAAPGIDDLILVAPATGVGDTRSALGDVGDDIRIVPGGPSRAASVALGLAALAADVERVLVHDAARPLVTPELVAAVLAGTEGVDGAIAAAPLADTVKRAGDGLEVAGTVDRVGLWAAQTPQAFWRPVLAAAVARAEAEGRLDEATDCAALVEAAGGRVRLVPCAAPNLKVTTPADIPLAEALMRATGRPLPTGSPC
jgi:2-C-methyl-D-erythritol 4-phosphate cytidylyltransferase